MQQRVKNARRPSGAAVTSLPPPGIIVMKLIQPLVCMLGVTVGTLCGVAPAAASDRFAVAEDERGGIVVTLDGKVFTSYVIDQGNKPFVWPVIGPDGVEMTRSYPMKNVPGEATDHLHHRGINFGHQRIAGVDSWHERDSWGANSKNPNLAFVGSIRHDGYRTVAGGETAIIDSVSTMLSPIGKPVLAVEQRLTCAVAGDHRQIDIAIDLVATLGPATIEDFKDAGLSIRVPESIRVDAKQGGVIVNSHGDHDAEAWAKRAAWVDYHGPVNGETYGIAFLSHPSTFRHPTPWHVRTYGLFTANPFGLKSLGLQEESAAISLKPNERVSLRYRLLFHRGDEQQADIAAAFSAYADTTPAPPGSRP